MFKLISKHKSIVLCFPMMIGTHEAFSQEGATWNDIPTELQGEIIGQLGPKDTLSVSGVNKNLHNLSKDDAAWQKRVEEDFPKWGEVAKPRGGEKWQDVYKRIATKTKEMHASIRDIITGTLAHRQRFGQQTSEISLDKSIVRMKSLIGIPEEARSLPPDFGDLFPPDVEELDLSQNYLTTLPQSIGKMTQLKVLQLRKNNLTEIPEGILQLSELKFLSLSGNKINSIPSGLSYLIKLDELSLLGNPLEDMKSFVDYLSDRQPGFKCYISRVYFDKLNNANMYDKISSLYTVKEDSFEPSLITLIKN